ncbi:MAG: alanine--glyoxylate aminotransferase family protein, partial [Candidatus Rokubacteria bacterium]|nr:alanine--glyoxylate aminotransferase family protein [Candidatus Rokubacteria bacterium]
FQLVPKTERPLLMIPGPTELPLPVMQALNQPATIQYDPSFDRGVLEPTTLGLREVFGTRQSEVILLPGSGRTGLEASALSLIEPGDRVLVLIAGVFGQLMREIAERAGAQVTEFPVEWGQPIDLPALEKKVLELRPRIITLVHNETSTGTTYPADAVGTLARRVNALFLLDTVSSLGGLDVQSDAWGVDCNMAGSQKCLAAPLGLALVAVGPRAWQAMEKRKRKPHSYAYDLLRWKELWIPVSRGGGVPDGNPRRQPISIPTHLTQAMNVATRLILEEGMPARVARHRIAGQAFRAGLDTLGHDLFPHANIASDTVSCFKTPNGIESRAVVTRMKEAYGILITTGLDRFRERTLRVGHMGITASPIFILPTLSALELALRDLGHKGEPGAAVAAAQSIFANV